MKRCSNPNCDSAFLYGEDKEVCPFCHSELVHNLDNAEIHLQPADRIPGLEPVRNQAAQFIHENLSTMECHGRIVEIDHQELFNSKRLKLINTIFRGEPYQFAHQTIEYTIMHYDSENQEGFEPVRILDVHGNVGGSRGCLSVPRVNILNQIYHGYADLVSWQTLQSLEKFCSMPINSYTGFYVRNNNVTDNTLNVFPEIRPIKDSGIAIGSFINSSVSAVIPLSALYSHMLITGATRSGKTTTVKGIVKGLYDMGISTLVIEAAKKEYIGLLSEIPELKVLTPGNDGLQLFINPLQVETGTLIENHVDAVVRAITASTAGEHPIPEALEGLLKQTYEKAGWHYGMMAYEDERKPFPTFKDAYNNIPEYIRSHARYGAEVKQNLEGALTLRTENMYTGALGRSFSKPFGITAEELLETPTVIELADFSDTGTEFLMNILLFKLHCYISRLPESNTIWPPLSGIGTIISLFLLAK